MSAIAQYTGPYETDDWPFDVARDYRMIAPIGVRVDASKIVAPDGARVTVRTAAAAGATALPVDALENAVPAGTLLDFGGAKVARVETNAAANANVLTVGALPAALSVGDAATYAGLGRQKKRLSVCFPLGRNAAAAKAAMDAGNVASPDLLFAPYVGGATHTEFVLTATVSEDLDRDDWVTVFLPTKELVIKRNRIAALGGWARWPQAAKDALEQTFTVYNAYTPAP